MIFVFCCLERLPKYGNHIFWNFYMNHVTENVTSEGPDTILQSLLMRLDCICI